MGDMVRSLIIGLFGSTGLIALELRSELEAMGHKVVNFSRFAHIEKKFHRYDAIGDLNGLSAIVNLAGNHSTNFSRLGPDCLSHLDRIGCDWSQSTGKPYLYISSGAVFGANLSEPVSASCPYSDPKFLDSYAQTKLESERRHSDLRTSGVQVSDLRMFSFAGPLFIKRGNYFLSKLFNAAKRSEEIKLHGRDFSRDFIGSKELSQVVLALAQQKIPPLSFNLFSRQAATKSDILALFQSHLNLRFRWEFSGETEDRRIEYYCANSSTEIGSYQPRKSIDAIKDALSDLLSE